jgi:hypothetical protein
VYSGSRGANLELAGDAGRIPLEDMEVPLDLELRQRAAKVGIRW